MILAVTILAIANPPHTSYIVANSNTHLANTMTTLDDIVKLIKHSDDSRSIERAKDKDDAAKERSKEKEERAKEIAGLKETISNLIKSGVKEEVESAIKPIQKAQTILSEEQKKLAQTVSILQEQLVTLQASSQTVNKPIPLQEMPKSSSPGEMKVDESEKIVRKVKKILGFSPITQEHIDHAKAQYNIEDENEAKMAAVKDLLYFEMKIPDKESNL